MDPALLNLVKAIASMIMCQATIPLRKKTSSITKRQLVSIGHPSPLKTGSMKDTWIQCEIKAIALLAGHLVSRLSPRVTSLSRKIISLNCLHNILLIALSIQKVVKALKLAKLTILQHRIYSEMNWMCHTLKLPTLELHQFVINLSSFLSLCKFSRLLM
jgi:hypothetical protein